MPLGCPERIYRCLRADWNSSLSGEQRDKQILQDSVGRNQFNPGVAASFSAPRSLSIAHPSPVGRLL